MFLYTFFVIISFGNYEKIFKECYNIMKRLMLVVLMAIFSLAIVGCGADDANESDNNQEEAKAEAEVNANENDDNIESSEDDEYYFDGDELVTEDFTIEITDYQVLQPGEGNNFGDEPILGFWFDVTLDEDYEGDDIDPNNAWILTFEAIQDNDPDAVNELDVGILPDEDHLDTQMQTIKPGGTVSSSISYELTDEETPVELIAKDNLFLDDELGRHEYEIE